MNKAFFFDKDGVLNVDHGIGANHKSIELYPYAGNVISDIRSKGYKIFVVTNQADIARGLLTEKKLEENLRLLQKKLLEQNTNAIVDKFYYCPHHPNANLIDYRVLCDCRKPRPGMIIKAKKEFNINLTHSFMIGDRITDILAGKKASCKTIFCMTGKHKDQAIETDIIIDKDMKADYKVKNISEICKVVKI